MTFQNVPIYILSFVATQWVKFSQSRGVCNSHVLPAWSKSL